MKLISFLLVVLALTACQRKPARIEVVDVEESRLSAWAADMRGQEVFNAWLAAVDGVSNRAEIITAYAVAADKAVVQDLATQSRSALVAKLDTLARGSNRHHYTKDQLERAIALKDEAASQRKMLRKPQG